MANDNSPLRLNPLRIPWPWERKTDSGTSASTGEPASARESSERTTVAPSARTDGSSFSGPQSSGRISSDGPPGRGPSGSGGPGRSGGVGFGGGFASKKTAFQALRNGPVARTDASQRAGFAPPNQPRLFHGARLRLENEVVSFAGYNSSGDALVRRQNGSLAEVRDSSKLELLPNQTFVSAAQAMKPVSGAPGPKLWRPSAAQKAALDASLSQSVGFRGDKVGSYVDAIRSRGFEAFIVGGAVRDAMVGDKARDVDLATTMWAGDVEKTASEAKLSSGRTNSAFGTVLIGSGDKGLDITSLKGGDRKFGLDLLEDVKHRDFTINQLFYDPASGLIIDPCGTGAHDAVNRVLRPSVPAGTSPEQWLRENSSAAVRLFKFTLRGYTPTPELLDLVKQNFKSCVRSMDGFRRSRMLESVGAPKEQIIAEMKRLGFTTDQIEALFPPPPPPPPPRRPRNDDDDDARPFRRFGGPGGSGDGPTRIEIRRPGAEGNDTRAGEPRLGGGARRRAAAAAGYTVIDDGRSRPPSDAARRTSGPTDDAGPSQRSDRPSRMTEEDWNRELWAALSEDNGL